MNSVILPQTQNSQEARKYIPYQGMEFNKKYSYQRMGRNQSRCINLISWVISGEIKSKSAVSGKTSGAFFGSQPVQMKLLRLPDLRG